MSITGGLVLYVTIWFLCLFLMLPFGHRSQQDAGDVVPGTPAGAPHDPQLKRKAVWATLLATLIFAVIAWVILGDIITRDDMRNFNRPGV